MLKPLVSFVAFLFDDRELNSYRTKIGTYFFVRYQNYGCRFAWSLAEHNGSVREQDNVFKDTGDFLDAMEIAEKNLPWWAFYYSVVCYKSEMEMM